MYTIVDYVGCIGDSILCDTVIVGYVGCIVDYYSRLCGVYSRLCGVLPGRIVDYV